MHANIKTIKPFKIIGIQTETTNKNGQAAAELGRLWERFYSEQIAEQIPHKVRDDIYSIYTDYESDYTGRYTAIIGVKVSTLDKVPDGCVGRTFQGGTYRTFIAKGEMPQAVVETWTNIWANDDELNRSYTADFEVYTPKSREHDDRTVTVYVAVG